MGCHSIQIVSQRTGLSAHTIRAWERRYRAIQPARSQGRHRLYSESEVERLRLLANATQAGWMISRLAHLDNERLRSLSEPNSGDGVNMVGESASASPLVVGPAASLEGAFAAIEQLDAWALEDLLQQAQVAYGDQGFLRHMLAPLAREVGERWRSGKLTGAQEHFFTETAKAMAWNLTRQCRLSTGAPRLVVGTPVGQIHDFGALLVAATAANAGWRVAFVGANLPAFELAGAVRTFGASALALSLVYPENDPALILDLKRLGQALPAHIQVFAGGRAAANYARALGSMGATLLGSLEDLDIHLDAMRRGACGEQEPAKSQPAHKP
ncbi:MAG: MerR family transcriptional regulator [Verrucomicrobia bacterium]|nr:MerR family transcriptional regulator [Verrucomicrobiota bacterium]